MIKKFKADVKKRKVSQSKYGSELISFEDLGKVKGYFDYITLDKGEVAGKIVEDSTHIFICQTRLDIEQGDKMYIDGKEYEVNFVNRPMMGKQAEIELKPTLQQNDIINSFIYYGFTDLDNLLEIDILQSDNESFKEKSFVKKVEGKGNKLFIAYPKSFGKSSIRLNHRPITNWDIKELMINGIVHYVYSTEVNDDEVYIELF